MKEWPPISFEYEGTCSQSGSVNPSTEGFDLEVALQSAYWGLYAHEMTDES